MMMRKPNFTPGPWQWNENNTWLFHDEPAKGYSETVLTHNDDTLSGEDAALLKSAPLLAEALAGLLSLPCIAQILANHAETKELADAGSSIGAFLSANIAPSLKAIEGAHEALRAAGYEVTP
jgi:hypothetical protein